MVSGESLAQVRKTFGRDVNKFHPKIGCNGKCGVTGDELLFALLRRGIPAAHYYDYNEDCKNRPWRPYVGLCVPARDHLKRFTDHQDTFAIANVPSRVIHNSWHWIVLHNKEIYDPCRFEKLRYRAIDSNTVSFAVVGSLPLEAKDKLLYSEIANAG